MKAKAKDKDQFVLSLLFLTLPPKSKDKHTLILFRFVDKLESALGDHQPTKGIWLFFLAPSSLQPALSSPLKKNPFLGRK